jgi:hypothetical protein
VNIWKKEKKTFYLRDEWRKRWIEEQFKREWIIEIIRERIEVNREGENGIGNDDFIGEKWIGWKI